MFERNEANDHFSVIPMLLFATKTARTDKRLVLSTAEKKTTPASKRSPESLESIDIELTLIISA
ncbi:MAG: hypothetical protein KBT28_07600 [Bacteroidales bacterium]|nr:hypothetical protein [Candidatus Colimorpha merdihippi]